ncbi:MAG: hypothetical protein ACFKPT_02495 [Gloeotrichia echinulata GP01]
MANRYDPRCISYRVDPTLLEAGIPIENLEHRDLKIFEHGHPQKTTKLAGDPCKKKPEIAPKTPSCSGKKISATIDCIILTVESADYAALKSGRLITIPSIHAKSIGMKFQITNKATNSYCFRILCLIIGNKGYFV